MKNIKLFLALGMVVFLLGNISAQPPKCNGREGDEISVDIDQLIIPAPDADSVRRYLKKMIILNAADYNLPTCNKCPKPNGQPCELQFGSWSGSGPTIQPGPTPGTFKVGPTTLKFKVKCAACIMPAIVMAIPDPLNGTLASCDGLANVVTLSMPSILIYNPEGDPMTMDDAIHYWNTIIILDNGNFIEGSVPWGCAMSACVEMGYEGGCQMTILESGTVPTPTFDEETQGWFFEEATFTMAYSCSACGADGEGGGDDTDMGKTIQRKYAPASSLDHSGLIQQMFPNPASEYLSVMLGETSEKTVVTIVDVTGKTVFTSNLNASPEQRAMLQIDITHLASGIYYLNVVSGERQSSREVVVEK